MLRWRELMRAARQPVWESHFDPYATPTPPFPLRRQGKEARTRIPFNLKRFPRKSGRRPALPAFAIPGTPRPSRALLMRVVAFPTGSAPACAIGIALADCS